MGSPTQSTCLLKTEASDLPAGGRDLAGGVGVFGKGAAEEGQTHARHVQIPPPSSERLQLMGKCQRCLPSGHLTVDPHVRTTW